MLGSVSGFAFWYVFGIKSIIRQSSAFIRNMCLLYLKAAKGARWSMD